MPLPKMRTAPGVLAEIRAADPNTEVSLHMVRRIINSGRVPVVNAGNRKLVNVDAVLAYLEAGENTPDNGLGKIRQLPANL